MIVRVWLTVHTQGVVAGDEAVVGIQAEHILRGEHPIYYYGQPYMGSLAAYFIAFIFLITGPSVWALRIEPTLVALVLVYLTWRFSAALADAAHLSGRAKTLFMVIATLVAAFPPLFDVIEEMGAKSGYVEAFTIMLWLLFCAFRLTQRWRDNASPRELALRWAGIGFLVGLGFWINPLVVYAYVAIALWIGYYVISELVRPRRQAVTKPRLVTLKQALLFVRALPAILIGFAPGLYWGAQNQWQNIGYVFQNGGAVSHGRLHTILKVQQLYITCLAPRAIGGALPTNPGVTVANPHILTFGLVVSTCCLAISALCVGLSVFWPHRLLVQIRRLTMLPLLFFFCASIIFSTASIATTALIAGCGPWNIVGRYVVPLVIALPFLIAAVFTIPATIFQERLAGSTKEKDDRQPVSQVPGRLVSTRSPLWAIQVGFLAVLAIYFCVQAFAYIEADPRYTFQASGCASVNPTNLDPIISYMQQAHIRFAWATGWIATPITFRTDSAILVTEPHGRIPADSMAVLHADRPSILLLARHDDSHPAFLKALDARNVVYHAERFYSVPGVDELVITPLNRTVSPLDPAFADAFHIGGFHSMFSGCL
ncbi:MAG: hypothetical protein NVSMB27_43000 [Ktedonobacteraceae bacterium]